MNVPAPGGGSIPPDPLFCFRCGHLWMQRSESLPRRCPRCHSSRWDVPVRRDTVCKFCGHEWRMGGIDDPCPICGRRQTEGVCDRSLHCNQCDHEWNRRGSSLPKKCPMCHSSEWNLPKAERLMCRQCGHVWRKQTDSPARCPACLSKIWDQPLRAVQCQRCGHLWKMRGQSVGGGSSACPGCRSRRWNIPMMVVPEGSSDGRMRYMQVSSPQSEVRVMTECRRCGRRWYSNDHSDGVCPGCGSPIGLHDRLSSSSMVLWSDGRFELTYIVENDCGFVYLWDDDIPVATLYVHEVLRKVGMTIGEVVDAVNGGDCTVPWKDLADEMYAGRDGYERYMDYFMKRLSLSKRDSRILSIHFTGMNPAAIAKHFGYSEGEVLEAFDRIMKAYSDSGIVVDDTVFTEDPFRYY